LFAAAALAFCPTSIGWNRSAVTAGDTFVTTFFALALWLLYRALQSGSGRALAACVVGYGLAFGTKFSAVLLIPVCVLYAFVLGLGRVPIGSETAEDESRARLKRMAALHGWVVFPLLIVFIWPVPFGDRYPHARAAFWVAALAIYVAGYVRLLMSSWVFSRRHLGWVVFNICVGGCVATAFTTPYHAQGEAIGGLIAWGQGWLATGNRERRYLTEFIQTAGLPWIQMKVPFNLLALCGVLGACTPRNLRWGSLFLIGGGLYLAAITLMPNKFPYYGMPVMPLLSVLAGWTIGGLIRRLGDRTRLAAGTLGAALLVTLGYQVYQVVKTHPYYLLADAPWERALILRPEMLPVNTQLQAARPVVEWLAKNAAGTSQIAAIFPGGIARDEVFRGWVSSVWSFEVRRLQRDPSKELLLTIPLNAAQAGRADCLVFFPLAYAGKPDFPGYVEVYEVALNGVPSAWVFWRCR